MTEVLLSIALFILGGYFVYRISRRGLSDRYERKPETPWSSLSEGKDPTL